MSLQAAQQFVAKASEDAGLQQALAAATEGKTGIEASSAAQVIAQDHGFDTSAQEIEDTRLGMAGELNEEQLEAVAGGKCSSDNTFAPVGDALEPINDFFSSW